MAYICYYEVNVQGTDKACRMVYESMPSMDFKDITFEKGKMLNHELSFTGFCADTVDKGTTEDWDKGSFDCDSLTNREIVDEAPGFQKFTHRIKSEKFLAVIKIHSWSAEAGFDRFDYYDNGNVVKQIVVPYDPNDKFDWEYLDYPSNMKAEEPVQEEPAENVAEPVEETVAESVIEPVAENVAESVIEPVVETVAESVVEPVEEPVEELAAEPVVETFPEPVSELAEENVVEETPTPVVTEMVTEKTEEAAPEKTEEPEINPFARFSPFEPKPVVEVIKENTEEATEPVVETTAEPVAEAVAESVAEAVEETVPEAVTENVIETVVEEATEDAYESVTETVAVEPITEAVQEIAAEPVIEAVEEVAAELVPETVPEIMPETVNVVELDAATDPDPKVPDVVLTQETEPAVTKAVEAPVPEVVIPETVFTEPVKQEEVVAEVPKPVVEAVPETVVPEPVVEAVPEITVPEPSPENAHNTIIPGPALEPATEMSEPEVQEAPQPKNIVENPDSIYTDYRPIIAMKERQLAALQSKQKEVAEQFREDEEDYLSVKDYISNDSMSAEAFATSIHNDIFKMEAQKRVKEQQLAAEQAVLEKNSQMMDNDTAAIRADMKVSDALSEVYKDLIGEYSRIAFKNKNNKAHYESICMGQRQNDNKAKALQNDYSQIETVYNQKTQGDRDNVYYLERDIRDLQERINKKQQELKDAQNNPDQARPDYSDIEKKYNESKASLYEINAQIAQLQTEITEMSKRV